ncbi:hypothetical protein HDU86_006287 [Geranomyces michiganensis]|nr:hypothetical protein HDU86_006287 [Geranomyces michiganensis]
MEEVLFFPQSLSSLCNSLNACGKRARAPRANDDDALPHRKCARIEVSKPPPTPPPPQPPPPAEPNLNAEFYLGSIRVRFDVQESTLLHHSRERGRKTTPVNVILHFQEKSPSASLVVDHDGLCIIRKELTLKGEGQPSSALEALAICVHKHLCVLSGTLTVDGTASYPLLLIDLRIRIVLAPLSTLTGVRDSRQLRMGQELRQLFFYLHPPRASPDDDADADVNTFLSQILPPSYPAPGDSPYVQVAELQPTLLAYQRRAVIWMLDRECVRLASARVAPIQHGLEELQTPMLYERVQTDVGSCFYLNRLDWILSFDSLDGKDTVRGLRGGILADEMGLGKTVILLALILLHRAPAAANSNLHDRCSVCERTETPSYRKGWICCDECDRWFHMHCVRLDKSFDVEDDFICPYCAEGAPPVVRSRGTLIITPASILEQWATEAENHSPSLNVFTFTGTEKVPVTAAALAGYDLVLTSYDTLRKEIHAARPDPGRSRREDRQYKRRVSSLVGVTFFRIVLDEAQMVESSVSAAAAMASMIATYGSRWAVTGTPVGKKGLDDLHGLIKFLRIEPLASDPGIWHRLQQPAHRALLKDTLRQFMHRNTKANVAGELVLPPQSHKTLYLEFSRVERAWYNQLFDEMLYDDKNLMQRAKGPDINQRRGLWLLQLRQTCCHPQVGAHNKKVLGGALRSINDVLALMLRQAKSAAFATERQFLVARVYRAQMLEIVARNNGWTEHGAAPLAVYGSLYNDIGRSLRIVEQERNALILKQKLREKPQIGEDANMETGILDDEEELGEHVGDNDTGEELDNELVALTARIRSLQELQHRIVYFTASVHHSMKNQEKENEFYEVAEKIRVQLLGPVEEEARTLISQFLAYVRTQEKRIMNAPLVGPVIPPFRGGFAGSILSELKKRATQLDSQWETLIEWRKFIFDALSSPLKSPHTDEEPPPATSQHDEPKMDEYQKALELQTKVDIYRNRYMTLLADRKQLITGDRVLDEKREILTELPEEKKLRANLEKNRRKFTLKPQATPLRQLMGELRRARVKPLPEIERRLVEEAGDALHKILEKQRSALDALETESRALTKVFNARLLFYRDLQHLSDGVQPAKEPHDVPEEIKKTVADEIEIQRLLATQTSRVRYLQHMMAEEAAAARNPDADRECLICKSPVHKGLLTPCGHIFCASCIKAWVSRHRKCPLCNQPLSLDQCRDVVIGVEPSLPVVKKSSVPHRTFPSGDAQKNSKLLLGHLSHVPLAGSFGTKLDTLIRHIKYLKQTDPTSKSLVFSQWEQLLDYLGTGLAKNGIEYVNAGLTLVSANNVFLIEPVVNPALEAQAINRVHRIGQSRETTVWRYIISDTIEERVAALSHRSVTHETSATAPRIALNSRSSGDGERVEKKDVEWCLFGSSEDAPATVEIVDDAVPSSEMDGEGASSPPVLDESATATLTALERYLEENGLPEQGERQEPAYKSCKGRGMAGRRKRR